MRAYTRYNGIEQVLFIVADTECEGRTFEEFSHLNEPLTAQIRLEAITKEPFIEIRKESS